MLAVKAAKKKGKKDEQHLVRQKSDYTRGVAKERPRAPQKQNLHIGAICSRVKKIKNNGEQHQL